MTETGFKRNFWVQSKTHPITWDYTLVKKLGEGTYGHVYQAVNKQTNKKVAIKQIARSHVKNQERLENEINILKNVDHPNIVRVQEIYEDARNICFVTEICKGGELFDAIHKYQQFSENTARRIFLQIIEAVKYLHDSGIVHRDLKPENLLFSGKQLESSLKLIDFGFSTYFDENTHLQSRIGTPYYISPEILRGDYDESCDIWSCGVILYILLSGTPPFHSHPQSAMFALIQQGKFNFPQSRFGFVSEEAKDLIRQMLIVDTTQRIAVAGILEHPWMHMDDAACEGQTIDLVGLRAFADSSKFRRSAITIIASRSKEKDIESLAQQFKHFDKNQSGKITYEEFKQAVWAADWQVEHLHELFESLDLDCSGEIEYTEFLGATLNKNIYLQEENLWEAFRVFDVDNSGTISAEDIKQVLAGDSSIICPDVWARMLTCYDENNDGVIDFEEF